MQDLLQKQIQIEESFRESSLLKGEDSVHKHIEGGTAIQLPAFQSLMRSAYQSTHEHLEAAMQKRCAGVGAKYRTYIRTVGTAKVAAIALHVLLNRSMQLQSTMQSVLLEIGRAIEVELYAAELTKIDPAQTKHTEEYLERGKVKSVELRANAYHAGIKFNMQEERPRWTTEACIQTGKLAAASAYETGLFLWEREHGRDMWHLRPSPELTAYADTMLESIQPLVQYPPMIVAPCDWKGLYDGGYYTDWYRLYAPLCSFRKMPKEMRLPLIRQLRMPKTELLREAVNKAQSVPYRINKRVLAKLQEALGQGDGCMGLPRTIPEPKPEFPFQNEDWREMATELDMQRFKVWKHQAREWHVREHLRIAKSYSIVNAVQMQLKFKDYEEIYFPAFIDWRGRLYYRGVLNPQSVDSIKACIEFAHAEPMQAEGLYWLRVHIANCCGYDKVHFDKRVEWVLENTEDLRLWYNDCLNKPAPDPSLSFQLYAALDTYFEAMDSGNPEAYCCHIPVAMDATCSGLQHFSAMLRDEIGAEFVNCDTKSTEQKADIYREVANRAVKVLPEYCDEVQALYWKQHEISRGMAKRPVMTYVYGSTLSSSIDYVTDDMLESGYEAIKDPDGNVLVHQHSLAVPVAKALRYAVEATVPKAAEMMKWLRKAVRTQSFPLQWTTPMGLTVLNWVDKQEQQSIKLRSMGVNAIIMRRSTGELDKAAAANSISPNFVHSMDACHMQMTVHSVDFPMLLVHDSFACHAQNVSKMQRCIREKFYELYGWNDIKSLILQENFEVEQAVKDGWLHPQPDSGSYQIHEVRSSIFFFC
jgi:DNA-directed RNA polymerase